MRELDFFPLTKAPEFEQRCNAFVKEVVCTIQPKYPNLSIDAGNETLEHINKLSERIVQWKRLIPAEDRERFIRSSKRIAERGDKQSAFFNLATVDISDLKGLGRGKLVKKVAKEVRKIASKYQPNETFEDTNYDDRYYPSAHLGYFFS